MKIAWNSGDQSYQKSVLNWNEVRAKRCPGFVALECCSGEPQKILCYATSPTFVNDCGRWRYRLREPHPGAELTD